MEYETAAGTSPRALAVAAVTSLPSRSRDRSEAFLETSVTHARRPVSKLSLVRFGDPEPVLAKHVVFIDPDQRKDGAKNGGKRRKTAKNGTRTHHSSDRATATPAASSRLQSDNVSMVSGGFAPSPTAIPAPPAEHSGLSCSSSRCTPNGARVAAAAAAAAAAADIAPPRRPPPPPPPPLDDRACSALRAALTIHSPQPTPEKTVVFFEFSLCLSRACLGKKNAFIYTWLKTTIFAYHRPDLCNTTSFLSAFPMFVLSLSW